MKLYQHIDILRRPALACVGLLLIFSMLGCKKGPGLSTGVLKDMQVNNLDFQNFSGKAKLHFDDGKTKMGATAGIRMLRDSIIWISVSPGLGIEAARGFFTTDSVFFINKINREYYTFAYSELEKLYGIRFKLRTLQDMLLGNMIETPLATDEVKKSDNQLMLKQKRDRLEFETLLNVLIAKPDHLQIRDAVTGSKLSADYENFADLAGVPMARSNKVRVYYRSAESVVDAQLSIDFSKAEINVGDLSFPFSIPDKYERKN